MSKNEITGDEMKSKLSNKAYEDGWDRIFSRMDIIGLNGNDGLHYESLCSICGKELEKVTECAWTSCPKLFEGT